MSVPEFFFCHAAISVANLEESIEWYRRCLDFKLTAQEYVPPVDAQVAVLTRGPVELELFCCAGSAPMTAERMDPDRDPHTQGVKHFCLGTAQLDALVDRLREQGVDIVLGPVVFGGRTLYYIHDNSGNLIELMQRD